MGTDPLVIYSVFCAILRVVFKNIVFYRVSGPSAAMDFILATLKKHRFYAVLASERESGTEKSRILGVC